MRCPDCNKFVSMDTDTEPEVSDLEVDEDGNVTVSVRIVNNCADCGQELKDANFSLEGQVNVATFKGHVCKDEKPEEGIPVAESMPLLEAEEDSSERTERSEGKGRGTRTFYGASVDVTVKCGCGEKSEKLTLSEEVQASEMDELV